MPYSKWHAMLGDERYAPSSKLIRDYLTLAKGLESPTPYHIWSFISLFAALAGSRIYIDQGAIGRKKLNLGLILIGFPAIRKSSAISVMERFSEGLPLQYGPTDTSGQRQGIMAAMLPRWQYDVMTEKEEYSLGLDTLEMLANFDSTAVVPAVANLRIPPASELYFTSPELGQLLASPSRELMDFFTNSIDGIGINYQLKTQQIKIKHPLINLLGATTPGSLRDLLPKGATEHGFLSRLIFIYCDRLTTKNPIPVVWDEAQLKLREQMLSHIEEVFARVDGGLVMTDSARMTYIDLYNYSTNMNDVRLRAYMARRSDHVLRVSAIVALMRGALNQQIIASDVRLAHALLAMTEGLMPKAFFGLSQRPADKILLATTEFLESQPRFRCDAQLLFKQLMHLGNTAEIKDSLDNLVTDQKLKNEGNEVVLVTVDRELAESRPMAFYQGAALAADEFRPMRSTTQEV